MLEIGNAGKIPTSTPRTPDRSSSSGTGPRYVNSGVLCLYCMRGYYHPNRPTAIPRRSLFRFSTLPDGVSRANFAPRKTGPSPTLSPRLLPPFVASLPPNGRRMSSVPVTTIVPSLWPLGRSGLGRAFGSGRSIIRRDWHDLCLEFPHRAPDGGLIPNWPAVAESWDGVHVTLVGVLSGDRYRYERDGEWSMMRFCHTEQTWWLDRLEAQGSRLPDCQRDHNQQRFKAFDYGPDLWRGLGIERRKCR